MNHCRYLSSVAIAILFSTSVVAAQEENDVVDSERIAEALTQPRTRSLSRAIGVQARTEPKVDLDIPFEVNSSELAPQARRQLEQLSDALSGNSLAGFRFQIAGHTDGSGTAEYNRRLSEMRANTVMQYLIDEGVNPERLEAVGFGEEMLLVTGDPAHPDNRRVEIRNLGPSSEN